MRSAGKKKERNNDGTIYPPSGQAGRDQGTRRKTPLEVGLSQRRTGFPLRYAAYPTKDMEAQRRLLQEWNEEIAHLERSIDYLRNEYSRLKDRQSNQLKNNKKQIKKP